MATLDSYLNLYAKKLLGATELGTYMLTYLQKQAKDALAHVYSQSGVFRSAPVDLTIATPDAFGYSPVAFTGVDGLGRVIAHTNAFPTSVAFQNAAAVDYSVALTYVAVPGTVETNPGTGAAKYGTWLEWIGWSGTPNSVAVQGAGLRLVVDALVDAGHSSAGRTVRVYLDDPASSVGAGTTWEDLTVQWDGANNYVDSAGVFGQGASPSLVAADYTAVLQGPRVSRLTDFSVVSGHLYLGTVKGGGAGLVPTSRDTSGQVLLGAGGFGTFAAWCVEWDAHGYPKIAVRADGADAATPQVSVMDSGGTRRWWITEVGKMFTDVVPAGVALGSAAPHNALDALVPGPSLIGGVNLAADHERILDVVLENAILSGCAVTAGAGLTVNIASGVTLGAGRRVAQAAVAGLAVPAASTVYIVWTGASFDISLTYPPASRAFAARVETDGVGVTLVTSLLRPPADLDNQIDLNVGGPNAHFSTVYEAVGFVNAMARPGSGAPSRSWRILVRGSTAEPAAIKFWAGSVVIQGLGGATASATAPARIVWAGNRALFDLNGQTDLVFRDLSLLYDDGAAVAATAVSRVAFDDTSGGGATRVRWENVRIGAAQASRLHGYLTASGGGTLTSAWIDGCTWGGASEFGASLPSTTDLHVRNSDISTTSTTQAPLTTGTLGGLRLGGAGFGGIWIQHCRLQGWGNRGIVLVGCEGARVEGCDIHGADVNGTTTKYVGIEVDNACIRNWIRDCRTFSLGATAATAIGIENAGDRTILVGNDCKVDAAPATKHGIELTAASANCVVDGNQTNAQGLTVAGGPHSLGALNRDDV